MISKNKIKLLRLLKLKKYREQHQSTLLEGLRLIDESINYYERLGVQYRVLPGDTIRI